MSFIVRLFSLFKKDNFNFLKGIYNNSSHLLVAKYLFPIGYSLLNVLYSNTDMINYHLRVYL